MTIDKHDVPTFGQVSLSRRTLLLGALGVLGGCKAGSDSPPVETAPSAEMTTSAELKELSEAAMRAVVGRVADHAYALLTDPRLPYQSGHESDPDVYYLINKPTDTSEHKKGSPIPYIQVYYYPEDGQLALAIKPDRAWNKSLDTDTTTDDYIALSCYPDADTIRSYIDENGGRLDPKLLIRIFKEQILDDPSAISSLNASSHDGRLTPGEGLTDDGTTKGTACLAEYDDTTRQYVLRTANGPFRGDADVINNRSATIGDSETIYRLALADVMRIVDRAVAATAL